MQNDDVVWSIINNAYCSFKIKFLLNLPNSFRTQTQTFCKNPYNVTGLCTRQSCPLANSNYATVKEEKGKCILFVKTIERCQTPANLWEKIELDKNYKKALEQVGTELEYWPKFLMHKCKQRLTKLRQMLMRLRKLKLQGYKEYTPVNQKIKRREKIREQKAVLAADIEGAVQDELLQRLQQGIYGDIYNLDQERFKKAVKDKEIIEEEQEEDEIEGNVYLNGESDLDNDDGDEEEDMESSDQDKRKVRRSKKQRKQKKKLIIQYENEDEQNEQNYLENEF